MNSDSFIEQAIRAGDELGLTELSPIQQVVYAISEAEVWCDMEGIDTLIDKYGANSLILFAHAYSAIGAGKIAKKLNALHEQPASESLRYRANRLITERSGYTYGDIWSYVAASGGSSDD